MKSRTVILFLILSLFLTCPCFSRPLKIAFITDTHYGPSLNTSYIERIKKKYRKSLLEGL